MKSVISLGFSGNSKQRRLQIRKFNRTYSNLKKARYPIPELVQIRGKSELELKSLDNTDRDISFTCDKCRGATVCKYSYDGYNTNGDCLAEK